MFFAKRTVLDGHAKICMALGYPVATIPNRIPGKGEVVLCSILETRENEWSERCDEIFVEALAEVSGQMAIAEKVAADGEAAKRAVEKRM